RRKPLQRQRQSFHGDWVQRRRLVFAIHPVRYYAPLFPKRPLAQQYQNVLPLLRDPRVMARRQQSEDRGAPTPWEKRAKDLRAKAGMRLIKCRYRKLATSSSQFPLLTVPFRPLDRGWLG